jgi:hypothetical protein
MPMPTEQEIRDAIHWWQVQDSGTEEEANAAVAMANLLRRIVADMRSEEGGS